MKKLTSKFYDFLRYTQKITGVDNVYFFKGGFWMMVMQILIILTGIAVSVAFAHLGTKALYGKYQFVLAMVATFSIALLPGSNTALVQSVSRGYEKTIWMISKQKYKWSLLGSAALLGTAGYFYFIRSDVSFAIAFVITGIAFPFTFWDGLLSSFFAGRGNFSKSNYYLITERLATTIAILAILFIKPDFIYVVLVYYLVYVLVNIANYLEFRKKRLKGDVDKEANKYGMNLTWINLVPKAVLQIDRLILPAFLGVEALAVYVIATVIPDTIDGFLNLMNTVAFKKLVDLPQKEILKKLFKWWLILFFVFVVAATIIGIPFAIHLLYGNQYIDSIRLSQMYALMLPASFAWKIFNNWLLSQKRTKTYFYFYNGFYILNTILFAGIVYFTRTLQGAIIARVLAVYIFAILSIFLIKKGSSSQAHTQA